MVANYYKQNQAEALDLNMTGLETLVKAAPDRDLNELKSLIGRMGFDGDGMDKKVGDESGRTHHSLAYT
mgnify:CR=1 FL=1